MTGVAKGLKGRRLNCCTFHIHGVHWQPKKMINDFEAGCTVITAVQGEQ
jgi:hypothetical protein